MAITTDITIAEAGEVTSVSPFAGVQSAAGAVALDTGNTAVFYIQEDSTQLRSILVNSTSGALVGATGIFAGGVDIARDAYGNALATSVTQLDNGNLVVTWAGSDGTINFRIFNKALQNVTGTLRADEGTRASNHPDIVALNGGGFVVVWEETFSTTDHDIYYRIFDSAGVAAGAQAAVSGALTFDEFPSVARTTVGFAIGFDQKDTATGNTAAWVATYNAAGTPILAPAVFDSTGTTNRHVQMESHASGWVATYEDSQFDAVAGETSLARFVAGGTPTLVHYQNLTSVSAPGAVSRDGIHLMPSSTDFGPDHDVYVSLAMPDGTIVNASTFVAATALQEVAGQFVWTDASHFRAFFQTADVISPDTDGGIVSRLYSVTRTTTGDNAGDLISFFGTYLNNIINSGGGDDDVSGGHGRDVIDAGPGTDTVRLYGVPVFVAGGEGSDALTINLVTETAGTAINLTSIWTGGTGSIGSGTVTGFEQLGLFIGTNFADTIHVGANSPTAEVNGEDGDDILFGGNAADRLSGGNGRDTLVGNGGDDVLSDGLTEALEVAGNELYGGAGNDTYQIISRNTTIIELAGEGTADRVNALTTAYFLPDGIEQLTFGFPIRSRLGVGNALDNIITGTASRDELFGMDGNDRLSDGGGVIGQEDTLFGGPGNDTYVVRVRGSSTIELADAGHDTVETFFAVFALQANIEDLRFIDDATHAGVGNVLNNDLFGGTGADDLFGREGNDSLFGGAGAANSLFGQEGSDEYVIDAFGDSIIEYADQGFDTVRARGIVNNVTLSANVEELRFLHNLDSLGIGNNLGNAITGGGGNDTLSGLAGNDQINGGPGLDTLIGGSGQDTFQYELGFDFGTFEPVAVGLDRVLDFTPGEDRFEIRIPGAFGPLTLVTGGAPVPISTARTILYDVNSNILSYDHDGTGPIAAIPFAQINVGQSVSLADFFTI